MASKVYLVWMLGIIFSLLFSPAVWAEPPVPSIITRSQWVDETRWNGFQPISFQSPAKESGNEKSGNSEKKKEPKHIRDNAFLVEEAFNQEPGEVQHIFNWVYAWDRTVLGRTRDMAFAYTMELPICSQKHQFSFTTLMFNFFEQPSGGPAEHQGGVGDTFLNYRYQLLGAEEEIWWSAPRFSLILPTGDERFGLGTGQLGYLFNLPISRYGEDFDVHFNAGVTYIPNVSVPLAGGGQSGRHDLHAYNLGGSVFYKPKVNLHYFVEVLAVWGQEVEDTAGTRNSLTQVFVNPGVRYAIYQGDEVEWVVGVSVPVGLTRDTPATGLFAYMSVEHAFRKKPENAKNGKNGD